jgi:hypothetical protein
LLYDEQQSYKYQLKILVIRAILGCKRNGHGLPFDHTLSTPELKSHDTPPELSIQNHSAAFDLHSNVSCDYHAAHLITRYCVYTIPYYEIYIPISPCVNNLHSIVRSKHFVHYGVLFALCTIVRLNLRVRSKHLVNHGVWFKL